MPRACVIVLDAVGAGELPDAADWGDEGSDTLGNVARAVGGLDLPNLEALGLGNVEPLEGCPPQPGAPAVAGRLLERSKGKDTTAGHWELMGVVTPTAFPTYPYGFPDEVIDPFMNRTGRGVLCNKPASGTEIIQELGEEHQRTGKWIVYTSADSVFQIAAHEETIPLEELYDGCRAAREILTGKHAVGRVIARPFVGDAGPLRADAEPARLLARAAAPELPDRDPRRGAARSTASGRSATSSPGCDIDESFPTKSNVDGINRTIELLENIDGGPRLHEPRRDRPALGPPQRPRQLPPLPAGLRPPAAGHPRGAPRRRPADPHLRSRLRPDDAVDRPLARARAAARVRGREERGRADPRGRRVRRRRRDGQRLARREASRQGRARAARSSSGEPRRPAGRSPGSTRPRTRLEARRVALRGRRRARPAGGRLRGGRGGRAAARARGRRRPGRARRADARGARLRGRRRSTSRRAWSSSRAPGASTRSVGDVAGASRSRTGRSTASLAAWMLYHAPRPRPRRSPSSPRAATRRPARRGDERATSTSRELRALAEPRRPVQPVFTRENGARAPRHGTSPTSSGATSTAG